MDDALAWTMEIVEGYVEFVTVSGQRFHLNDGDLIGARSRSLPGGDVVVHRRHGQIGPSHGPSVDTKPFERLRGGDLMDEVHIDVQQIRLARRTVDDMGLPDLVKQCLRSSRRYARNVGG